MLQPRLILPESSSPGIVAPRSTTARSGCFSSSSASSGPPIRLIQEDVEEHVPSLLGLGNPASLTSKLRQINASASIDSNTFVSRRHVLHIVIEEDVDTSAARIKTTGSLNWLSQCEDKPVYLADCTKPRAQSTLHERTIAKEGLDNVHSLNRFQDIRFLTSSTNTWPKMSVEVGAPGSPPELTESQTSNESSYPSQYSPDEIAGGNMNFEEINLDDENHHVIEKGMRKRPEGQHKTAANRYPTRRPVLATLQTQQKRYPASGEDTVKSAATPYTKRTFTSPAGTSSAGKHGDRTRSESPALHHAKSTSKLRQVPYTPKSSLGIPGHRGSWQPKRKTVYEIEAEYHDSDDELPHDASLFNVPLSPFTSHPRNAPLSGRSSTNGSPERDSPARSPAPIPLGHTRTLPDVIPKQRNGTRTLPRHRGTPRAATSTQLPLSKSASNSPRNDVRFARSKSWNIAMADLDHEARVIAEKLDFHYEARSKFDTASPNNNRNSAPGAIPLPPIQRGTLDFMPVSKEKEAVLSRTRPSWLPPKDPREEKKHLEEYKRMMKASLEAEKKKEDKQKQNFCVDDTTRESLHRIWTYYIEPTTAINKIDSRVNDLCWRGIPPKLRGAVWQKRVGNSLGLTRQSYKMAVDRVKEIKSRPTERLTDQERTMQEWFADIERDAETAFPDLSIFQRHGVHWQDLVNVCEAYSSYRGDIGYVYGMQLVAALILIQLPDPAEAFILLANCLNRTLPHAFQTGDIAATSRTYSKAVSTLNVKFPQLHDYLFNDRESGGLGFTGEELFEHMFRTVFANGLDLDRLCRAWDIWIFESDRYLIRTAVALLGALQDQIFDLQGDIDLRRRNIQEMLGWGPFNRTESGYWKLNESGTCDTFVADIRAAGRLDCTGR